MSRREQREKALARQVARTDRRLARLNRLSERLSWARLIVFVAGFVISGGLFFVHGPLVWVGACLVWLALFGAVVAYHRRLEAGIRRHALWRDLKKQHLARMALDWTRLPAAGELPAPPPTHPFAVDLDLYGEQSLQHLIDTAVSYDGSLRLQQRLLDVDPALDSVRRRQALTRALRPLSLFRDRLALQGLLARKEGDAPWRAESLLAWVDAGAEDSGKALTLRPWVAGVGLLGLVNLALIILWQLAGLPPVWMAGLGLTFLLTFFQGRAAARLFQEATSLQDALRQLAVVFSYLERPRFQAVEPLYVLCAPFRRRGGAPSHYVRRLGRLVAAAGISRNPVLWLALNVFFPWDLYFAYRLRRLRAAVVEHLPQWLDVWFELEAASSLANLGYLNPGYAFPEVSDAPRPAVFAAEQMGHPLIAAGQKVCNDFTVGSLGEIYLITGSNMAGKSSFLRTAGVNLCLAYAGGPVDATALQTGLFRLFTAMRITDSVTDGISYFYAEVKRLKALLVALEGSGRMARRDRPLFYLIDEIFRGTNNRERLLGSRAYIRALAGKQGVGLIATHDLELVRLAEELPQVSNFHFRDFVSDGRMLFDYRLRPGPSPTTNALRVMVEGGLPVPADLTDT